MKIELTVEEIKRICVALDFSETKEQKFKVMHTEFSIGVSEIN